MGTHRPHRCSKCCRQGHRRDTCPFLKVQVRARNVKGRSAKNIKFNKKHTCRICGKEGHRADTCPFNVGDDHRHRLDRLDRAIEYSKIKPARPQRLREVKEVDYPDIVKLTETQSKHMLMSHGLLNCTRRVVVCWNCGNKMKPHRLNDLNAVRCVVRTCRIQLRNIALAHTPIWHLNKGGQLSYKVMLYAMYTLGIKTPIDAAQKYMGCGTDPAENWRHMLMVGLAYAELFNGRDQDFGPCVLEFDGTKTNIVRKHSRTNTHAGRFLVCIHRETGMYSLEPMADVVVEKGAPPPPESINEIRPFMARRVTSHHMVATDAAKAMTNSSKHMRQNKKSLYAYVVHSKKQFCKVLRIPFDRLSPGMRAHAATINTTNKRFFSI